MCLITVSILMLDPLSGLSVPKVPIESLNSEKYLEKKLSPTTSQNTRNNIKRIYKYLEKKDISKINGSNPKSISAGLVYYYLININKIIDPDTFSKIVGLSKITILKISKFIASVIDESSDTEEEEEDSE